MQTRHPRAIDAPANRPGLSYAGVPWKIVLHTTESVSPYAYDPSSYFGNPFWPHATIDEVGIHQHLPIDVGAYALAHAGGPETNRANAVQCEIVWRAGLAAEMPDAILANVADWADWVSEQTGAPLMACPQGFHGAGEGIVIASESSPIRFRGGEWTDFTGVCGHQHVPSGNDHWDPGAFPWTRMIGFIRNTTVIAPRIQPPKLLEENTMRQNARRRAKDTGGKPTYDLTLCHRTGTSSWAEFISNIYVTRDDRSDDRTVAFRVFAPTRVSEFRVSGGQTTTVPVQEDGAFSIVADEPVIVEYEELSRAAAAA